MWLQLSEFRIKMSSSFVQSLQNYWKGNQTRSPNKSWDESKFHKTSEKIDSTDSNYSTIKWIDNLKFNWFSIILFFVSNKTLNLNCFSLHDEISKVFSFCLFLVKILEVRRNFLSSKDRLIIKQKIVRVHSHVMNFAGKSDFAPDNFSSKFLITCPNPILLHFSKVRISDFAPISIRSKNLEQNRKFELLTSGAKSELDTWSKISKRNCLEQNRIFEQSPSRENLLLQTLFRSKKGTTAYMQITFNEILINYYSSRVVRVLGSPFLGQSIPLVEINNPF